MSAHRPSFARGLGMGLVLALAGGAVLAVLAPWLGVGLGLRAVIALVAFAYVLHVIGSSGERVGRITTIACWCVVTAGAWVVGLPFVVYVLVHVGLVWLVRSLYHYSGVLPALVDLGVSLLGAAFGAWAAQRTGSVWLALWCFFLVQAFHALIPATLATRGQSARETEDAFAHAHRAAEAAVRRLTSATR